MKDGACQSQATKPRLAGSKKSCLGFRVLGLQGFGGLSFRGLGAEGLRA